MKLSEINPDAGQIERGLVDLHRTCHAFVANVYDHAEDVDPHEEIDWGDMALGFLLGAGCELPYEDNIDGSPAGYTMEVHRLLDQLCFGVRNEALDKAIIAVVSALYLPEHVAEALK